MTPCCPAGEAEPAHGAGLDQDLEGVARADRRAVERHHDARVVGAAGDAGPGAKGEREHLAVRIGHGQAVGGRPAARIVVHKLAAESDGPAIIGALVVRPVLDGRTGVSGSGGGRRDRHRARHLAGLARRDREVEGVGFAHDGRTEGDEDVGGDHRDLAAAGVLDATVAVPSYCRLRTSPSSAAPASAGTPIATVVPTPASATRTSRARPAIGGSQERGRRTEYPADRTCNST